MQLYHEICIQKFQVYTLFKKIFLIVSSHDGSGFTSDRGGGTSDTPFKWEGLYVKMALDVAEVPSETKGHFFNQTRKNIYFKSLLWQIHIINQFVLLFSK